MKLSARIEELDREEQNNGCSLGRITQRDSANDSLHIARRGGGVATLTSSWRPLHTHPSNCLGVGDTPGMDSHAVDVYGSRAELNIYTSSTKCLDKRIRATSSNPFANNSATAQTVCLATIWKTVCYSSLVTWISGGTGFLPQTVLCAYRSRSYRQSSRIRRMEE